MATNTAPSFTEHTAPSSGSTAGPYSISFTYIDENEIDVTVDGVLKTAGVHYNINPYNSGGQSTVDWIGTAPTSPSVVRVVRQTDVMNNGNNAVQGRATFQAGSSVKADDLNNNTKQALQRCKSSYNKKPNKGSEAANAVISILSNGPKKI